VTGAAARAQVVFPDRPELTTKSGPGGEDVLDVRLDVGEGALNHLDACRQVSRPYMGSGGPDRGVDHSREVRP
jgi:hypothetical protein